MNAQELLDKYIKYNSKITFDIFKLIYHKLIDLGFTNPHNIEEAFKEFSGDYPYFVLKLYNDKPYFNQYSSILIEQSEISVKDILGYNPFENFTLPEKWCIKVEEMENTPEEIVNWRLKIVRCGTWVTPGYLNNYGYHTPEIDQEYTEITLEQFKEYVLKEPVKIKTSKTEKDWSNATKEELIAEAKRRYPVGCIFNCLVTGYDYVMKENVEFKYEDKGIYSYIDNSVYHEHYENNQWAEVVSLPECKVESTIEYAECTEALHGLKVGQIYEVRDKRIGKYGYPATGQFKPSTKEAFEAQNKPKSIGKWSIGTYGVVINSTNKNFPIGFIDKIVPTNYHKKVEFENYKSYDPENLEYSDGLEFEWFATLTEAEEFAKTLISPSKFKVGDAIQANPGGHEYEENGLEIYSAISYLKVNSVTIGKCTKITYSKRHQCYWYKIDNYSNMFTEDCITLAEPVIESKQVVHCKTQEEWDFVSNKIDYKFLTKFELGNKDTINPVLHSCESKSFYEKLGEYQVLSFQEWCDLNGYKMKKTRFKTGDYVVSLRPEYLSTVSIKFNYCYIQYKDGDKISIDSGTTMYEDDINYARLATPEEIAEYKRVGKPYDVTTLQPSEISTYGLNVGDFLDTKIINDWGGFAYNRCCLISKDKSWQQHQCMFSGDRTIKSFKLIDGIVGFLVSDTSSVYLRAEGFKEFADNYYTENTSNFKVGSWYKYNGYYLKYSKTDDRNIFIASEYINTEDNSFKDDLIDFTCGIADDSKKLVTDLSVIQQYLPEEHPDKIVKNPIFEAGKWYRVTDGKNKEIGKSLWYVKSLSVLNGIIKAGEYWHDYLSTDGCFGSIGDYTFTEVPLSEIQQFLPDGHPDLFTAVNKNVEYISETFKIRVTSKEVKRINI